MLVVLLLPQLPKCTFHFPAESDFLPHRHERCILYYTNIHGFSNLPLFDVSLLGIGVSDSGVSFSKGSSPTGGKALQPGT